LRAVPVEAHHFDEEEALDFAAHFGRGRELVGEGAMLAGVEDFGVAEDSQALAIRVIHEEERDAVVAVEIAGGEHLAVAFEIREAELMRAEHAQEARGAAAVLNVKGQPSLFVVAM